MHGEFPVATITTSSPFTRELFGWLPATAAKKPGSPDPPPLSPENLTDILSQIQALSVSKKKSNKGQSFLPLPSSPIIPIPCALSLLGEELLPLAESRGASLIPATRRLPYLFLAPSPTLRILQRIHSLVQRRWRKP